MGEIPADASIENSVPSGATGPVALPRGPAIAGPDGTEPPPVVLLDDPPPPLQPHPPMLGMIPALPKIPACQSEE